MYPKTKTFKDKAVIIDKGVFPAIPKIMQKKGQDGEQAEEPVFKKSLGETLWLKNNDYSDKFREGNMEKVKHLFQKTTAQIQPMQWMADLRHWHPDRIPKQQTDDDHKK